MRVPHSLEQFRQELFKLDTCHFCNVIQQFRLVILLPFGQRGRVLGCLALSLLIFFRFPHSSCSLGRFPLLPFPLTLFHFPYSSSFPLLPFPLSLFRFPHSSSFPLLPFPLSLLPFTFGFQPGQTLCTAQPFPSP